MQPASFVASTGRPPHRLAEPIPAAMRPCRTIGKVNSPEEDANEENETLRDTMHSPEISSEYGWMMCGALRKRIRSDHGDVAANQVRPILDAFGISVADHKDNGRSVRLGAVRQPLLPS